MLLDAHVRQMNVHIVQLGDAGVIFHGAKTTKAQLEQVRFERTKRCDQHVQTQIEFLAANQQRVVDVPRYHVALFARLNLRIEGIATSISRPFPQFGQFVDEENAGALWFAARFHDPRRLRVLAILFDEHVVIGRQHERRRNEIQVQIPQSSSHLRFLCQRAAVAFQILAVPFDILHQQIFARQFIVIGEVIDDPANYGLNW